MPHYKTCGMKVRCIAAPLLKCKLKGKGRSEPRNIQRPNARQPRTTTCRLALARLNWRGCSTRTWCARFHFGKLAMPRPQFGMSCSIHSTHRPHCRTGGITLAMENDFECNIGTGAWSAKFIKAINSPNFRLLWDAGNAYFDGEAKPYPDGYANKISSRTFTLKTRDATHKVRWNGSRSARAKLIYWVALRALNADGYHGVIAMENHYTPPNGTKRTACASHSKVCKR